MGKTYAAFYIPQSRGKKKSFGQKVINKVKRSITKAIKISNLVPAKFNTKTTAEYFNKNSSSAFAVKYAVSGFCDLLTNGKITSKTKIENLFEILSPILPSVAFKSGLSNVAELESVFLGGIENYNISEFLKIMNEGINTQNNPSGSKYSNLGNEIPIDVVESCGYEYAQTIAQHRVQGLSDDNVLLSDLSFVKINFTGHIKNPKGELVKTNYYMQKLGECMKKKQPIVLRIGKDVYENCLIESMSPVITNIYELKLVMTLQYSYNGENFKKSVFGGTVLNPAGGSSVAYYLAPQSYAGIIS